jgi:hypothetical protein
MQEKDFLIANPEQHDIFTIFLEQGAAVMTRTGKRNPKGAGKKPSALG